MYFFKESNFPQRNIYIQALITWSLPPYLNFKEINKILRLREVLCEVSSRIKLISSRVNITMCGWRIKIFYFIEILEYQLEPS